MFVSFAPLLSALVQKLHVPIAHVYRPQCGCCAVRSFPEGRNVTPSKLKITFCRLGSSLCVQQSVTITLVGHLRNHLIYLRVSKICLSHTNPPVVIFFRARKLTKCQILLTSLHHSYYYTTHCCN